MVHGGTGHNASSIRTHNSRTKSDLLFHTKKRLNRPGILIQIINYSLLVTHLACILNGQALTTFSIQRLPAWAQAVVDRVLNYAYRPILGGMLNGLDVKIGACNKVRVFESD